MNARVRRGVTLIETLVVLALIALLASVAVLSAPSAPSGARDEAERFAARFDAAQAFALASGAPLKVELSSEGYGFFTYRDRAWTEVRGAKSLRRHAVRRTVAVTLASLDAGLAATTSSSDATDESPPQFLIDPLGGSGEVSVAFADRKGRWVVTADRIGSAKVARDGG